MTGQADRHPVVVGVDGSPASDSAVDWAADEARRRGSLLRIVHVFPVDDVLTLTGAVIGGEARGRAHQILDLAAGRARRVGDDDRSVQTALVDGRSANTLIDESTRAALLVVGSRGHGGFASLLLGSTAVQVTAQAHCPVAVVPHAGNNSAARGSGRVVVGVDASAGSDRAVEFAFARAAANDVGLVAVHAWQPPTAYGPYAGGPLLRFDRDRATSSARARLEQGVAAWRERYAHVAVELSVVEHHPVAALAEASEQDTDVVVVGSRGRSALGGTLLGSVSQGVLRHARTTIVVAR